MRRGEGLAGSTKQAVHPRGRGLPPWFRKARIWAEAMGYPDPQQAIVAQLAQPRRRPVWESAPSAGGWQRAISRGGGHDADPDTMRFVKQRKPPGTHHLIERQLPTGRNTVGISDGDSQELRHQPGPAQASERRLLRTSIRQTNRDPDTHARAAAASAAWKLPNFLRIVFSDGRIPAAVHDAEVGKIPRSSTKRLTAARASFSS